jgi:hypothetical protein
MGFSNQEFLDLGLETIDKVKSQVSGITAREVSDDPLEFITVCLD